MVSVVNAGLLGRAGGKRRKVEAGIHAYQSLAMGFAEYMLTELAGVQQIDGRLAGCAPGVGKSSAEVLAATFAGP